MQIGKKKVGIGEPTYFIADLASNHGGSLKIAKEMIREAAAAGADAAKFQHFKAKNLVSNKGFEELGLINSHQIEWKDSVFETYRKMEVPDSWTKELVNTCNEVGIEFLTTPYDLQVVPELDSYLTAYKIGSGDISYHDLILNIAKLGKPLLIATGASKLEEVIDVISKVQVINSQIVLMQCNTNYTGSDINSNFANISVLEQYKNIFPNLLLGLSDHTVDNLTVLAAVSLGARVIEKHFKGENSPDNPDLNFSLNSKDWSKMVSDVRRLEKALGDGRKKIELNENETRVLQRRSIRYRHYLPSGHIISENDLVYLRPSPIDSLPPYISSTILGKSLRTDVQMHDCVSYSHFE